MSNLTLPKMTYVTLNGMLANYAARGHGEARLKIAYATHIERYDGAVTVYHHGNAIAHIAEHSFTLSGSGWNSPTTATRLAQILKDNQTPVQPGFDRLFYSVSSRNNRREYGLFIVGWNHETKLRLIKDIQHWSAHFSRVDADHHFVLHE